MSAGDAIHPMLQKGVVWFTRLVQHLQVGLHGYHSMFYCSFLSFSLYASYLLAIQLHILIRSSF